MDTSLPSCLTVIAGRSSSGKTTFALKYLLNAPAACRFIFDDTGQASQRLGKVAYGTARNLENAVPSGWVIFNPHVMFKGRMENAFRWFCQWAYDVSTRGPGKKIVFVDEIWKRCTPYAIPQELADIVQTGRVEGIELCTATQRPNKLNGSITGQTTELVCFALQEKAALETIDELGADADAVQALPLGSFIAYNLDTGTEATGKMW